MSQGFRPLLWVGLVLLAPSDGAGDHPRASLGSAPLPNGVPHEIVVEQDLAQPDTARITVGGRNGRAFAAGVKLGDDVTVDGLFKGEVVGIEPVVEGRRDRVVILAFNRLHRLTRERKSRDFFDVTDAEMFATLAQEHSLTAETSSEVPSTRYDHVYQDNQTDLEFLRMRAARLGFEVWCEDTTLLLGRREAPGPVDLARRRSDGDARLLRFHPRLSSSQTVQKVEVRGFDPERREITGEAAAPTILLTTESDPDLVFGRTLAFTVDHPISSTEEANAIAKAKLEDATLSYVTGEAEALGDPQIKPGALVTIVGAGTHFDGRYYVQGVSHRITHGEGCGSGYRSRPRLRRQPIALFFIPEIDDEVLVAFEHGDIRRPVVVGSLWDDDECSSDRPPEP